MGENKSTITKLLSAEGSLPLKTIAQAAHALGYTFRFSLL